MREGLNRVMLMGHLGADPELRYTQSGTAVLNMRLATTETYFDRDRQKQERTDWHSVVLWGKRGEALAQFLKKGAALFVEGSLRTSSYEARDGSGKRYKTEVNARNVILLNDGGGRQDEGQASSGGEASPPPDDDPPPAGEFDDDDIPF